MAVSALFKMMQSAEERGPSEGSWESAEAANTTDGEVGSTPTPQVVEVAPWVVRYSPQERRLRVERYREKRRQRSFKKTIRYDIRKKLADTRPRIRGRFSKPAPPEETEALTSEGALTDEKPSVSTEALRT
eukprot:CAMPEP_0184683538 /NCGR_PEP_ID=MMETSP0312-20130426/11705_1 /TAXON_ID=31354 /ORGANISM="Compsopogon coeruleus, Strain SAG 36.94" /LENGTH=130 /DNA_ID=CAMNT_0027135973 /DNA_START=196 /DNA_END=588 /DNA_ORIENTATION=-